MTDPTPEKAEIALGTFSPDQEATINDDVDNTRDQLPQVTQASGQGKATGYVWPGLPIWLATGPRADVESVLGNIVKTFKGAWRPAEQGKPADANGNQSTAIPQRCGSKAEAERKGVLDDMVMYGEMVQAVYDTLVTKDVYSPFFGNCVKGVMDPGKSLGDPDSGIATYTQLGDAAKRYKVLARIEADSGAYKLVIKKDRNYVGFIAEGPPDKTGAVDIAIVFRGTVTEGEWFQDCLAVKVCWNDGEQAAEPPAVHLTASPFYSYFSIALITSIITFVVLSSKYTSWIVKGVLGVLLSLGSSCLQAIQPSAAPVCLPVTSFVDLLKAYMDKVDLVQWVFKHIIWIDDTMVSPRLLSLAAFAGITAYVLWGMIAALLDKPTDWWNNVLMSFRAVLPWCRFLSHTILINNWRAPWAHPKVSYGFKEMYCDSLAYKVVGKDKDDKDKSTHQPPPPSPRQTVYKTLADVLETGKKIKSITITGHSLGGALASMCGFDLSTAMREARGKETVPPAAPPAQKNCPFTRFKLWVASKLGLEEKPKRTNSVLAKLYEGTKQQRGRFKGFIGELPPKEDMPVVAVVTFAAPRVGDASYADRLGERTVMNPWDVREPFNTARGFWGFWRTLPMIVAVLIRDHIPQALKMPWHWIALFQVEKQRRLSITSSDVKVGMLRLANAHDLVPMLPMPLPTGFYYQHGGYELILNSYLVPYFKNSFIGAGMVARHNLEVYLHLLDKNRDIALVNKSASVLIKDKQIPDNWWDPVPHKGLKQKAGKWDRDDKVVPEEKERVPAQGLVETSSTPAITQNGASSSSQPPAANGSCNSSH